MGMWIMGYIWVISSCFDLMRPTFVNEEAVTHPTEAMSRDNENQANGFPSFIGLPAALFNWRNFVSCRLEGYLLSRSTTTQPLVFLRTRTIWQCVFVCAAIDERQVLVKELHKNNLQGTKLLQKTWVYFFYICLGTVVGTTSFFLYYVLNLKKCIVWCAIQNLRTKITFDMDEFWTAEKTWTTAFLYNKKLNKQKSHMFGFLSCFNQATLPIVVNPQPNYSMRVLLRLMH